MRRYDDQPLLSPSDLNNLLECRHLMALEIARFNGNGVLVASPDLLTVRCKTVEQMRPVNALCRFVELAS